MKASKPFIIVFILFAVLASFIAGWIFSFIYTHPGEPWIQIDKSPTSVSPILHMNSEELTKTVNDWRISQNFSAFEQDDFLCAIAYKRAQEIKSEWSHNGWEKYIERTRYVDFGENLFRGHDVPEQALEEWLASSTHKANLEKNYQYSCIQCHEDYCAQEFANF